MVTGGTGFIGSHTVVELLNAGFDVTIYDNLVNSKPSVVERIEAISGRLPRFVNGDIRDHALLSSVFQAHQIESVIHFAGLKAVGESATRPLEYYDVNVRGSLNLIRVLAETGVRRFVFSSSATVYGNPGYSCYSENTSLQPISVYGRTKLFVEHMLKDFSDSNPDFSVAILRYFNPGGAHPSGLLGEDPKGVPNNLLPFVGQVAAGVRHQLRVFGDDYPTRDGTGCRDYVHVVDIAEGHLRALEALHTHSMLVANLGAGRSYSVLEVVRAFEEVSGRYIPTIFGHRRPGDLADYYADTAYAQATLNWRATRGLEEMCADLWNWQLKNPKGYP